MFYLRLPILQTLHEEHMAVLALLERLEQYLGRFKASAPPPAGDADTAALLEELAANMEGEISHHYSFEEQHLFPKFMELAGPGIPMMLKDEHDTIRPVAKRLAELAHAGKASGFSAETWKEFHELGLEMVEREVFHVQKEEMGFLPALDQMLPPDLGPGLAEAYEALKKG